jgi:hypothetical protein
VGIQRKRVNWVLDGDIRGFFDNMRHEWTMKFIEHRVADRRILRLIQKWLKAGVSEDGQWSETKLGTPQGAVVSPLLANVYLHYVFDLWVEVWRKKVARGEVVVVRYADDLVLGFQHRGDAERFQSEFQERLAKFGLELHPEKTRLIEFGRFAVRNRKHVARENPRPSRFWDSRISVEISPAAELLMSGASPRRSGWLRSSTSSRQSFNTGNIIVRVRSAHGFGRLCRATTNTMLCPATPVSCASSGVAYADCGGAF